MQEYIIILFLLFLQGCTFFLLNQSQPMPAILTLIVCFLSGAIILLTMGFEYIAWIIIIVYIGAIIILFLFSVMLLHIKEDIRLIKVKTNIWITLFFYFYFISFFFFNLYILQDSNNQFEITNNYSFDSNLDQFYYNKETSSTFWSHLIMESELHTLGLNLYTKGFLYLIFVSFILLISLIGSVGLIASDVKQPSELQQAIPQFSKNTKF